ncbi:MAG: PocR ligand-binding domain-containing protein [Verrucomicrobia bacterium]|nr:PocR ligand-binding domain-containing protein [Verrucomicrobiota bacterium]
MKSNGSHKLMDAVFGSDIYREYVRAFTDATGLPASLHAPRSWQLPHHGGRNENTFCSIIGANSRSCASCLQVQEKLARAAANEPCTLTCPHGMSESVVPVQMGQELIGFLHTGQVFRKAPTIVQFNGVARQLSKWGLQVDLARLREAYFQTRVMHPRQYEAMVKLLAVFAQHLSLVCNQIAVQQRNAEPPVIVRAKEFILNHQAEELSLGQVAKAVNTSTFYFCKIFKKATGLNFTDYLSRVRIEKARNLLLNPNLRVSEIAYEIGFQSLTHFNRVFKRVLGQSPTAYRARLPVT